MALTKNGAGDALLSIDEKDRRSITGVELSAFSRAQSTSSTCSRQSRNVEVIVESKEWGGFGDSSSEGSDDSEIQERGVRKWRKDSFETQRMELSLSQIQHHKSTSVYEAIRRLHLRFFVFSVVHLLDVILKIASLWVYWRRKRGEEMFAMLLLIEISMVLFSCYVTYTDQDIRQVLHKVESATKRWLYGLVAFLLLGVCQTIQVKRAWSHQALALDIISDIGEAAGGGWNVRQREHAAHISFLTGIPFIIVNSYAYTTHVPRKSVEWLHLSEMDNWILIMSNVAGLTLIGFGVVEIDISVSSFIKERYRLNTARLSQGCVGALYRLYPIAHVLFRAVEAMMTFTEVVVFTVFVGEDYVWLVCMATFIDYIVAVLLLRYFAASGESWYMHLILGLPFFIINLAFFIDTQEFAYPAQRVTRYIERWRLLKFVAILALLFGSFLQHEEHWDNLKACASKALEVLAFCSAMYYFLLLSLMRSKGDDLHTAALKGDDERVKQLLQPGPCGEAQDLNPEPGTVVCLQQPC
eukprot:gnl/MRDRNA2_/MRDRNA2_14497_c0_seq1.p1 gnl/MRDRNA2_/MRDRNA2_14497_c0~~gnl/MRDRNA2_/MRDRNA2_14497_c0_seq1.p1  ORF type:complete len:541 (+),score=56.17 gnl/MRDRNA2_/MRDRNA2_14497_c0_seq1:51-1625(+)